MNEVTKVKPLEIIKANKLSVTLIASAYCIAIVVGILLYKLSCQGIIRYSVLGSVT